MTALQITEQEFEEFKSQLTEEEYLEVGESIIEVMRSVLTLTKNGDYTKELGEEVSAVFDKFNAIQDSLGEGSRAWFFNKSKEFGLPDKYWKMDEEVHS